MSTKKRKKAPPKGQKKQTKPLVEEEPPSQIQEEKPEPLVEQEPPLKEQEEKTEPSVEQETPVTPTPVITADEGKEAKVAPSKEEAKPPDAERITMTAVNFLKRLGNKRSIRPMRVSREGEVYIVEVGLKKGNAVVQINAETYAVDEYEITEEGGSSFSLPLSPKTMLFVCGIATLLFFVFSLLGLQSLFSSILH